MPSSDASSSDDQPAPPPRSFGLDRPLRDFFGGGHVADVLLWKNKKLSGAVLAGVTVIWLPFELVEYNFVTLLCHILSMLMIILFIWSKAADPINKSPPSINQLRMSKTTCRFLFGNINWLLIEFYKISCGNNLRHYFLTLVLLWTLSVIGEYFSPFNILYFCTFLCLGTLPALYVRYQGEVDYQAGKSTQYMQRFFNDFNSKVLDRIPRAAVNQKKHMETLESITTLEITCQILTKTHP